MKEKKKNRGWWIGGTLALTAVGFMVIPPIIDRIGTKAYKLAIQNEEIDIDNLEPEIVKKPGIEEETAIEMEADE